ncbi:hypothetical protein DRP04_16015, partial [Archaeoglobales archaeon]
METNHLNNFSLLPITQAYKEISSNKSLYFLTQDNKLIKIKSITKIPYSGKIYDVDVANDIILVKREDSKEAYWSGNSNPSGKEEKIPYWIEQCNLTASDNATFWIKVPFLQNNTNTTVYLYYGNPEASSASDANSTFIRVIDGVVGSWHFDEGSGTTAYDTSGNDNDGTINGATWTTGKFGSALNFDGTDDYVDCGNDESLEVFSDDGTKLLTIEVTFRRAQTGVSHGIAGKGTSSGWKLVISSDDRVCFTTILVHDYYFNTKIEDTNWHHLVIVYDSNYDTSLYVDGQFKEKIEYDTVGKSASGETLVIGKEQRDDYHFNGVIDGVRIYNRALTADEISDLYNNYGYTTENYPGKVLVRKYASPEPTIASIGEEQLLTKTDSYGNYSYTFKAPLEAGTYTIKVNLTNPNGIYGENETTFVVDDTPPSVTIDSPKTGAYIPSK